MAHPSAGTSLARQVGPSQPPRRVQNPQQKMYERWRLMREAAAQKAAEKAAEKTSSSTKTQILPSPLVQAVNNVKERSVESIAMENNSQDPQQPNAPG